MGSSSASTGVLSLFLLLSLSSLFVGAAARPCKTLFIAYTFSSDNSVDGYAGTSIEVSQISATGDQGPSRFLAIYRLIPLRYYLRNPSYSSSAAAATEPLATDIRLPVGIDRPSLPRHVLDSEPSFGISSLRERARDILVVVAGLLFGVGCAALTSASVYLAWYLINSRYELASADGYDYVDDDDSVDDMESPKKMGYVGLPALSATPVAPLKEGFEGN
ncbi:unnamed protein product [Spirodela intermedia]|uniref:Uncharacterized protein n=1 Tax=Spirodela intermedia TaxID=51605 RepID=A0A7I8IXJ1_SPIIN|nr:unnamed protein product [Spirodela intermedia]CAA6662725.1 unnamed protein product [Spirodela intermedia]